ncbi:MAG: NADH-quinone oxidoreductase subunit H [Actinobacteria bacterium]|nr:MAG: NADH-quinone oxidoreductase subunit H [Actinomycetota bacterium]
MRGVAARRARDPRRVGRLRPAVPRARAPAGAVQPLGGRRGPARLPHRRRGRDGGRARHRSRGDRPVIGRVLIGALVALALLLTNGVVLIYMLRKVLGHFHLRLGPMRTGWHGVLQTPMDVLKLLTKEDFDPAATDVWLFRLAPLVVFVPSFAAYLPLAFSEKLAFAPLETGALWVLAALSVVPVGVLMAGWASNSKWSLLGGMRASAQQIAYEVPLLLALIGPVMLAGTLDLAEFVRAQAGLWTPVPGILPAFLPRWYLFPQFGAFLLFFIAALAELNQTPFDMSVAESELIEGFANEYSGMKFAFLFLAEFSNSFVVSALAVTVFFGGWMLPWVSADLPAWADVGVFLAKTYAMIFVLMWIRGTLPRMRIDQLLAFGWKRLIPAGLVWIMLTGAAVWLTSGVL